MTFGVDRFVYPHNPTEVTPIATMKAFSYYTILPLYAMILENTL